MLDGLGNAPIFSSILKSKFELLFYTTYKNPRYIGAHKHSCFEIVYYVKGTGTTTIDGRSYRYSEGTFSITLPGNYHEETHETVTEVLYIGFGYDDETALLKNGVYYDNHSKTVLHLMEKMKREVISKDIYYKHKLDLLLQELLIEYRRMQNSKNCLNGRLEYVLNFIDENYNQQIDMDTLAELSSYSYHRFRHIFKEMTGLSPVNYILNKKIDGSMRLLQNTDMTITDIAQECGFSNSCQFINLFKRSTGTTPGKYRTKINNEA